VALNNEKKLSTINHSSVHMMDFLELRSPIDVHNAGKLTFLTHASFNVNELRWDTLITEKARKHAVNQDHLTSEDALRKSTAKNWHKGDLSVSEDRFVWKEHRKAA
jgi:hypothetical protein